MRRSIFLAHTLLLAAVPVAEGAEFLPGWSTDVVWDSNVFRTTDEGFRQTTTQREVPNPSPPPPFLIVTDTDIETFKIKKEDDFSIRTGPSVRLREPQGDLTYDLEYQLLFEEYIRLNDIRDFDHYANGTGTWNIDSATTISVSDDFESASNLGGLVDTGLTPVGGGIDPTDVVVVGQRSRITTNSAEGSLSRRLGPLWVVTVTGSHRFSDFESESGSDSDSFSGTVQINRGISRRLIIGAGATFQRQEFRRGNLDLEQQQLTGQLFDDPESVQDSGTDFYQGFGFVQYDFSPTLRLVANGGPAWSIPDELAVDSTPVFNPDPDGAFVGSCSPQVSTNCEFRPIGQPDAPAETERVSFAGSFSDVPVDSRAVEGQLTYFGTVSLEKELRNWRASLSYQRNASSSSGIGASTTVDLFSGQLRWLPSDQWSIGLRANMSMQTATNEVFAQESEVESRQVLGLTQSGVRVEGTTNAVVRIVDGDPIDNPIDIRTYRVELFGDRRIGRNLRLHASASWYQQTNSGQIEDLNRSNIRFLVGATWTFDPIRLPF